MLTDHHLQKKDVQNNMEIILYVFEFCTFLEKRTKYRKPLISQVFLMQSILYE